MTVNQPRAKKERAQRDRCIISATIRACHGESKMIEVARKAH
jgi:hypothetical protein